MYVATVVVSALLAVVLVMSGAAKLAGAPTVVASMTKVHFPLDKLWLLAIAEIAGAAGLLVGLAGWPIGVAAATGVILYFVGALVFHLRVRDTDVVAPSALLAVAVAALVLRVVTI
jgi:uncharacterized membrane protein YphA (DoxX/SURF4 family)